MSETADRVKKIVVEHQTVGRRLRIVVTDVRRAPRATEAGAVQPGVAAAYGLIGGFMHQQQLPGDASRRQHFLQVIEEDRKSVVEGKRWSVRVELGGRRISKKKNKSIEHNEQ